MRLKLLREQKTFLAWATCIRSFGPTAPLFFFHMRLRQESNFAKSIRMIPVSSQAVLRPICSLHCSQRHEQKLFADHFCMGRFKAVQILVFFFVSTIFILYLPKIDQASVFIFSLQLGSYLISHRLALMRCEHCKIWNGFKLSRFCPITSSFIQCFGYQRPPASFGRFHDFQHCFFKKLKPLTSPQKLHSFIRKVHHIFYFVNAISGTSGKHNSHVEKNGT